MKVDLQSPIRITRSLTILIVCIIVFGFFSLYRNLTEELEAQTLQATEEVMVEAVHLFAAHVENEFQAHQEIRTETLAETFKRAKEHEFKATIFGFEKTSIGCDFYITDDKGIVLYDSNRPDRVGVNFYRFNDVHRALNNEYAARSTRENESDSISSVLYIAAPIKDGEGNNVGVLSLYKPQKDVLPFITKRHKRILISLATIGSGIALFIIAVFIWLFRPLGKLTEYARAINRGERPRYPNLGKSREANTLGRALREMRASLDGRSYMEHYTQMLTHELKSPIAAIQGAAELLDEDMPLEHRRKFLQNIQNETQRSTDIIDGLLKLVQLEAKEELIKLQTISVDDLVREIQYIVQARLDQKNLTIEMETDSNVTIKGDQMMLETAIVNLIENAIEFSPKDSSISLAISETSDSICFTVRDHGPGLPEFAKERAFEHFFSLREEGKGSGLGLVFVREVATLHSGTASIENHPEGGAVAAITIPRNL